MFVNVTDHAVGVQSPSPDLPECRHPVCVSECRTWWAREKVVLLPKVDSACAEHSALAVSSSILHSVEHLDSELSIATTPAHHHTPPSEPPSPPASPPSSPLPTSAPPSLPPALSLLPPTETAAPQAIAAARRAQRFSVNCGEPQLTVLSSDDFVVVEDTPVGPQPVTSAQFELVSPPLSAERASEAAPLRTSSATPARHPVVRSKHPLFGRPHAVHHLERPRQDQLAKRAYATTIVPEQLRRTHAEEVRLAMQACSGTRAPENHMRIRTRGAAPHLRVWP